MSITRLPNSTRRRLSSMSIPSATGLIKELLDNSIDARATSVEVLISQNIIDKIEVRDNGIGIHPDDFDFLGRPGCTSKLRCFEDLEKASTTTLGFRGEALSSAKSLAVVTITTKRAEDTIGTVLEIDQVNGGISLQKAVAAPVGTTVSATKLFGNLKVRAERTVKESQKTIANVKELLISYAMARPSLRLALRIIGSQRLNWSYLPGPQASIKNAVLQVLGAEMTLAYVERTITTAPEEEPSSEYTLEAYLASSRSTCAKLPKSRYISIDGRPVSARKGTMKKLVAIYKKHLQKVMDSITVTGGNPGGYFMRLNIRCPMGSYDANVEPAKDDVIFTDETFVLDQFEELCAQIYCGFPTQSVCAPEIITPSIQISGNEQRTENTAPNPRSPVASIERTQDCLQPTRCRVDMSDDFNQITQQIPVPKRRPTYRRLATPSPGLPMPQPLEEDLPMLRPNQMAPRDREDPTSRSIIRVNQFDDRHGELPILQPKTRRDLQEASARPFVQPNHSVRTQEALLLLQRHQDAPPSPSGSGLELCAGSYIDRIADTRIPPLIPTNSNNSMPMASYAPRKRRPQPPWTPPSVLPRTVGQRCDRVPSEGLFQSTISFEHRKKPVIAQGAFKPVKSNVTTCPSVEKQPPVCEDETLTDTTLETGDPRAYLLRRQKSIAIRPHKLRRLKSCLMPLEATPAENQLHNLSFTTNIVLETLRPYMRQAESIDRYIAEGENAEGLDLNLAKGKIIETKLRRLVPNKDIGVNLVGILKGKTPSA